MCDSLLRIVMCECMVGLCEWGQEVYQLRNRRGAVSCMRESGPLGDIVCLRYPRKLGRSSGSVVNSSGSRWGRLLLLLVVIGLLAICMGMLQRFPIATDNPTDRRRSGIATTRARRLDLLKIGLPFFRPCYR